MSSRIGFMQGRLSPMVNGMIQAFPAQHWRVEFELATSIGLAKIEWTLDQDNLYSNPLMTRVGQQEIRELSHLHGLEVVSITGDCFMQAPFWKAAGSAEMELQHDFMAIAKAASVVGARIVVVPLVDNGAIETVEQEDRLVNFLQSKVDELRTLGIMIAFESDFTAGNLGRFIDRLDSSVFGVNYDIGNSAGIGFDPAEEFAAYAHRITNVHVKDRVLNGTTVPLGQGNADFPRVFALMNQYEYHGNLILQTARAADDNHAGVLKSYREAVENWLEAAAHAYQAQPELEPDTR